MRKRPGLLISMLVVGALLGVVLDRWVLAPDFDQIYRIVLARVVTNKDGELVSIALAHLNDEKGFAPLPQHLQMRLARDWSRGGVDVERIIPSSRILPTYGEVEREGMKLKAFERYLDLKTKKEVRVYVIDSIRWLGSDEVIVSWSAVHASLDGAGSTLRLKRTFGFWQVVEESDRWIS